MNTGPKLTECVEAWLSPPGKTFLRLVCVGCGVILLGLCFPVVGEVSLLGGLLIHLLCLVWCVRLLMAIFFKIRYRHCKRRREPHSFRRWACLPVIVGFTLLLMFMHVPAYVAFFISKPDMDALANQIMSQMPAPHCPGDRWVGVFHACSIDRCGHGFRFSVPRFPVWGAEGFAYSTQGPPPDVWNGDIYTPFWGHWYIWTPPKRW